MPGLTTIEKQEIEKEYREIIRLCTRCKTEEDRQLIRKAFDFANEAHKNMKRKSGEPYFIHPISVAKIVAEEIGLGTTSVVCALLHDIVEDTDFTIEDIEQLFDAKIATIIDGLTKISHIFDADSSLQAENFRKMLITLSDDVRVIYIKLADRLHNMRTLSWLSREKQLRIAGETLFLYAPLANRLGLYLIKTELEDLSLKYEQSEIYEEISRKLKESERQRIMYINKFSLPVIDRLNRMNFNYNIMGRPKSVYSIWNKMKSKNISFEEVFDLFAIRIVFENDENITDSLTERNKCWAIYSLITDIYQPNPDRLRDWISTPKANGYEALHVTVMGPEGKWVEVQIRSERMDMVAERGYAAHWKYKGDKRDETQLDEWLKKIKKMLEDPESNALEFIDEFKLNLYSAEIFVFTPKGKLVRLPKKATALDFAYEIHSEIGNHAIGAKVNYKLVALSHILQSGDQVEILTSDKQKPQREWLNHATSAKAISKIKEAFKAEKKVFITLGKTMLENKLADMEINLDATIYRKLFLKYSISTKDELHEKIGNGIIKLDNLKEIIEKRQKNKWIRYWQLQLSRSIQKKKEPSHVENKAIKIDTKKTLVLKDDAIDTNFTISKCCNPIPGDTIMGYLKDDEHIDIHKTTCNEAIKIMSNFGDKVISVEWKSQKLLSFLARIRLNGIDELGLVNNITTLISKELYVNIKTIYFNAYDGIFEGFIDLYIHDTSGLDNLISDLKKINGIKTVWRDENIEE
ncbi:MAG: bifunctional (p)ppGpp synthetase/guanosine-3',5'-bis(diphosphate) 3'-pyrophosphohydrolase [Bacteroidia bacterium]|nr:bifunctional (p)ppGpp synthetase/guanosine-3',5'-bis(diphosphate) 3'-pyrophosphohydrolase [Bacteroidia bacterium]